MSQDLDAIFESVNDPASPVTESPKPEPAVVGSAPDPVLVSETAAVPASTEPAINPQEKSATEPVPLSTKPERPTWSTLFLACVIAFFAGTQLDGCRSDGGDGGDDQEIIDDQSNDVVDGDAVELIVVESSENRSQELSTLLRDMSWRESLENRQIGFTVFDDDQEDIPKVMEAVEGKSRPTVLIVVDGKPVMVADFPRENSGEAINKLLKGKTGR